MVSVSSPLNCEKWPAWEGACSPGEAPKGRAEGAAEPERVGVGPHPPREMLAFSHDPAGSGRGVRPSTASATALM